MLKKTKKRIKEKKTEKMEDEIWLPVIEENYSEIYLISSKGRIQNRNTNNILKPYLKNGYSAISLRNKGTSKNFLIHRLVAGAFIPNPENKPVVNHKDLNRENNLVSNLEWVTQKENNRHALETGAKKVNIVAVEQYSKEGKLLATFNSINEAAAITGCSAKKIPTVCRGKRLTTGGYGWKYVVPLEIVPIPEGGTPLKDYEDYLILRDSSIYSLKSNKFMISRKNVSGYIQITLSKEGKTKDFMVHVLVARTYIPNPDNLPVVNHKDNNKSNNHVDNLEWTTFSENSLHYHRLKIQLKMKPLEPEKSLPDPEIKEIPSRTTRVRFNSISNASHPKDEILKIEPNGVSEIENLSLRHQCSFGEESKTTKYEVEKVVHSVKKIPTKKAVIQWNKKMEKIAEFSSIKEASDMTGVSYTGIGSVCNGRYKTSGGFIWSFKN